MTEITHAVLDRYRQAETTQTGKSNELGQEDFFELMMAQLQQQDPMKPMENGEFLGQMAQFSTVTGIEEMQKALTDLSASFTSSQTLQSASLVGRDVLIESDSLSLGDDGDAEGSFALDYLASNVKLTIADSTGSVVNTLNLGEMKAGRHQLYWDGTDETGQRVPAGRYIASVETLVGEEYQSIPLLSKRTIDSVEFEPGGMTLLNTLEGESLTLGDVREIRQTSTDL